MNATFPPHNNKGIKCRGRQVQSSLFLADIIGDCLGRCLMDKGMLDSPEGIRFECMNCATSCRVALGLVLLAIRVHGLYLPSPLRVSVNGTAST